LSFNLLSENSKMPGHSWNLPRVLSCPGMVTGPGTICGDCYGGVGRFRIHRVQRTLLERWRWCNRVSHADFVAVLANTINDLYFRVGGVGDLHSAEMIGRWRDVCVRLRETHFWFATKSWRVPSLLPELQELATLPNATVRPSAVHFEEAPPVVPGLHAGLGASSLYTCPAPEQGHRCQDCRSCWLDKDVPRIFKAERHRALWAPEEAA